MSANNNRFESVLANLAEEIDVPPSKYEEAKQHYEAVGNWLGAEDSALSLHAPVIYPQGSFALGTAVRPLGEDDYDIDAVCLLQDYTAAFDQVGLKKAVGDRLKHTSSRYRNMLDPEDGGRRCWTIKYADGSQFHLDVLPAIPDDYQWLVEAGVPPELAEHAIRITDTSAPDHEWPRSNPKGYANWFKNQMRVRFDEEKRVIAMAEQAEVVDIEDFRVRTPLQRLVQLLKRHRDIRYNGDEDKPISIIITTLAASAYENEANLSDAVLNVVPRMRSAIQRRGGVWWVPNPVNPKENFADKWEHSPRKAQLFFEWLADVERTHQELAASVGETTQRLLTEAYGKNSGAAAYAKLEYGAKRRSGAPNVLVPASTPQQAHTYARVEANEPGKPWKT